MESNKENHPRPNIEFLLFKTIRQLKSLLNLKSDFDEATTTDAIKTNIDFKSASAWTLIFAIIIASTGLNVNSTAVIIGAMLISPLMGPIVGAGYALGVNDYALLQKSARNLLFAAGLSIATSTFFFLISPLGFEQAELLARTQPTFFDVIIAFFGGAAGIVAISRTQKGSNAIPGVAIATALMPPLCTAGFGLATGQLTYFIGALYLFVINCTFICVATFLFVRYLNFKKVSFADESQEKRTERWLSAIVVMVIIPSLLIAWILQRQGSFNARAGAFLNNEFKFKRSFVVDKKIEYSLFKDPKIHVQVLGETLSDLEIDSVKAKLSKYDLPENVLDISQTVLTEDIEKRLDEKSNSYDQMYQQLQSKLAEKDKELNNFKLSGQVRNEVSTLFDDVLELHTENNNDQQQVYVIWKKEPASVNKNKLNNFLKERLAADVKFIVHSVSLNKNVESLEKEEAEKIEPEKKEPKKAL